MEGAEFRWRHHLSGKPAAGSDQVAQHHAGLDGVEHRSVRDRRRGQGDGLPQRHLQRVRHLLRELVPAANDHRYGAGVAVDHGQRVRHHGRQRRGMHADRHHQGDRPQWQQGESAVRELPSGHRPGHRADRVLRAEPRCRAAWRRSVDHAARQQSQDLRQDRHQREHGDGHRRLRAEPGRGVRRGRRRAGPDQQHLRQQDHQRRVPPVLVRHVHRNAGVEAVHEHVSCRHQRAD